MFKNSFIMTKSSEQNQFENRTEKGTRELVEYEGGVILFDDMLN